MNKNTYENWVKDEKAKIDKLENDALAQLNSSMELADNIIGTQYSHLKCDTVEWSKQNHTAKQQKAICQFMLNKYSMRNKGQDKDDIIKIRYYTNWLEDIAIGNIPVQG